ncbi:Z-ring formation inhibitor MciZ [Paenibacillus allorhizosphaerae]|uniref:Uncharacterized protein n=1 Tax=Paenibacillus allorhizosphaerae TaxID=2849866 RepID=A0ABN7TK13_9BACL|nr:hypothetical protein PAECIP111802_02799 [Paenibacillus allorhizosphaerae]
MKTYYASNHIRLVGKAREIKNYIKSMLQTAPENMTLSEFMQGKRNKDAADPILLRQALIDRRQKASREPHRQPHTPKQKMADRRVIPFPSK